MGCANCKREESIPIETGNSKNSILTYWFGAPKGTQDFEFLFSDLEFAFMCVTEKECPKHEIYDFYCTTCADAIIEEQDCEEEEE